MGFDSSSHVSDRWETSALQLLLYIPDSIHGIKSSYPLPVLAFSWYMLPSEHDSLASGGWDNAQQHFYLIAIFEPFFQVLEKLILIQIIKSTMVSSYNET